MSSEGSVERPSPTPSPSVGGLSAGGSPSRAAYSVVSRFVKRYFPLLDASKASQLSQFYQEDSIVSRAEAGAETTTVRGVDAAVNLVSSAPYLTKDSVTLLSADIQEASDRSIFALTQGTLVGLDGVSRRFVQSLSLAIVPGSEGETVPRFYLRHDVLRYLDVASPAPAVQSVAHSAPTSSTAAPASAPSIDKPSSAAAPAEVRGGDAAKGAVREDAPSPAVQEGSDDKGKRQPRQPREQRPPKKENGKQEGAEKKSPATPSAEPKKESPSAPAAPATWAQRAAANSDKVKADSPKPTAASSSPSTAAAPSQSATESKEKAPRPPRENRPSPKDAPRSGAPSPSVNGSSRKERTPTSSGGGKTFDNSNSLVVRNVPYDSNEADLRAVLVKPAPEGYGIGAELTGIALRHGTAFLDFASAADAQRVYRQSQNVKVSIAGRELRLESRQAKTQGAPRQAPGSPQ